MRRRGSSNVSYRYLRPYVDIPFAPTFNSPLTKTAGTVLVAGELFRQDFGSANNNDGKDLIMSGAWPNGTELNTLQGTVAKPFRIKNDSTFSIGSNSVSDVVKTTGTPTNIELYGDTPSSPYWIKDGTGSALNFSSTSVYGTTIRSCNLKFTGLGYAFFLINLGAGSANAYGWGGQSYRKNIQRHNKGDGLSSEGEGTYNGTTHAPYGIIYELVILHNNFNNKGREGIQLNNTYRARIYNNTCRNVGIGTAGAGQNNLWQVQNSKDVYIANCIFDGAPNWGNIFSNDVTFENCYFRWTNGAEGFAGDPVNNTGTYFYMASSTNPTLNGKKITYNNCIFFSDNGGGTQTNMFRVDDRSANYSITNSIFSSNLTNIYNDQRGATPPNTLTGTTTTSGNQSLSSSDPAFKVTYYSDDIDSPYFNCITSEYHYNRGMGARTPVNGNLDICEIYDNVAIAAAAGTSFTSLGLSTSLQGLAQDGKYYNFNIIWDPSTYSTVAGTYTIFGKPVVPEGFKNLLLTTAQAQVVLT